MSTLSKLFTGKSFWYSTAAVFAVAVLMMFAGPVVNQADAAKRGFKSGSSSSFRGILPGKHFSHRRSGKRFSNRRFRNHSGFRGHRFSNRGFRNRGFRNYGSVNVNRAGVSLGHPTNVGNHFHGRKFKRRHHRNRGDRLFIHRRNTIEARNRALLRHQSRQFRNDGIVVDRYYQPSGALVISVPAAAGANYADEWSAPGACPDNHNCGYRVYPDGTGPRIIRIRDHEVVGPSGSDGRKGSDVVTFEELEVIN